MGGWVQDCKLQHGEIKRDMCAMKDLSITYEYGMTLYNYLGGILSP